MNEYVQYTYILYICLGADLIVIDQCIETEIVNPYIIDNILFQGKLLQVGMQLCDVLSLNTMVRLRLGGDY